MATISTADDQMTLGLSLLPPPSLSETCPFLIIYLVSEDLFVKSLMPQIVMDYNNVVSYNPSKNVYYHPKATCIHTCMSSSDRKGLYHSRFTQPDNFESIDKKLRL